MKQTFLLGQQFSELRGTADPAERLAHVCGQVTAQSGGGAPHGREPAVEHWGPVPRTTVQSYAVERNGAARVAIVCDAGLGKTTNMEWLEATIANPRHASRHVPFLLRLDRNLHLELLEREHGRPGALLDHLAAEVQRAAGGDQNRHVWALQRLQAAGGTSLLIDGLDHALSRFKPDTVRTMLDALLRSKQWKDCPVWIAGRSYAFEACWKNLFDDAVWKFLRIEPLAEREIQFYMSRHAGGDWYEQFPDASRGNLLHALVASQQPH